MNELFGRTNRAFPDPWLSLRLPDDPAETQALTNEAAKSGLPLDVTHAASVWGAHLPAETGPLIAFLGSDYALARTRDDACDLLSAQIVQVLSCLLGRRFTFLFLPVNGPVQEFQFDGALQALETARQDGLTEFTGISCEGNPFDTLSVWQFRDAFEALCVHDHEALHTLRPLAEQRRVGILTTFESQDTQLIPVGQVRQSGVLTP